MRVMSITQPVTEYMATEPSMHYSRTRALLCELLECVDAQSVNEQGGQVDVVILPGANSCWPLFWNEVAEYIEQLPAFKAIFSVDSYKSIWPLGREEIAFDALLPSQYTAYLEKAGQFRFDCTYAFWSPPCVDVQELSTEKDIDVFFWGNPGRSTYPFRNFILRELTTYSYLERIDEEDELVVNILRMKGREYRYARLPYRNRVHWGPSLYPLLQRAKICCTGSAFCHVPVARYFENAACGVVSVTNDFTDRDELGFEHGKNIWITDEAKFIADLVFLLTHSDVVSEMADNGRKLIAERHTVTRRAAELNDFLEWGLSQS
jgi:hypothetical protein